MEMEQHINGNDAGVEENRGTLRHKDLEIQERAELVEDQDIIEGLESGPTDSHGDTVQRCILAHESHRLHRTNQST